MHATQDWTWLRKITTVFVLIASVAILGVQLGLSKVIQSRVSDAIVETVAFIEANNPIDIREKLIQLISEFKKSGYDLIKDCQILT